MEKQTNQPYILSLIGPLGAGKSTIASFIKKKAPNIEIFTPEGEIEKHVRSRINVLQKHFEKELAVLREVFKNGKEDRQILDILESGIFPFLPGINESKQEEIKKIGLKLRNHLESIKISLSEVRAKALQSALKAVRGGQFALTENTSLDEVLRFVVENDYKVPIRFALIFCPFTILPNRVATKNTSLILGKQLNLVKEALSSLLQYASLMHPKIKPEEKVLEVVSRKSLEDTFKKALLQDQKIEKDLFGKTESSPMSEERLKPLLISMGFDDPKVHENSYASRFGGYHYVIDTSKVTPEKASEALLSA